MPSQFLVAARAATGAFSRPFSDPFTRANATTLGAPWIQPASGVGAGLGIVANRAARPVGSSATGFGPLAFDYALLPYGSGVQDISIDHTLITSGSGYGYLIFGATVNLSSYYVLAFNGTSGSFNQFLSKFVGSAETDYSTNIPITSYSGVAGATGRWRVTYDPSSGLTTVYLNGTQVFQTTISSPLSGTYCGIAVDNTADANTLVLDNAATG